VKSLAADDKIADEPERTYKIVMAQTVICLDIYLSKLREATGRNSVGKANFVAETLTRAF
jgi:hypothetical protein